MLREKRNEMDGLEGHKTAVEEKQKEYTGQLVKKGLEDRNMQAKIVKFKTDIVQHEKQVQ